MEFFLQLVARAGIRGGGGGGGTPVVGEKPPTSPSFGSGCHATLIRVKGNFHNFVILKGFKIADFGWKTSSWPKKTFFKTTSALFVTG